MTDHDEDESDSARTRALRRDWSTNQRLDALMDLVSEVRVEQTKVAGALVVHATRGELHELRINSLEKIVYGVCGIIGVSVVTAIIALVIRMKP